MGEAKCDGFKNYIWHSTPDPVTSLATWKKVTYLTPDSSNVLTSLDSNTCYVIGGLVDDSIKKNSSQTFAGDNRIVTARLPIDEHTTVVSGNAHVKRVLTVNQVFDILVKYKECGDWKEALSEGLPKRYGLHVQ